MHPPGGSHFILSRASSSIRVLYQTEEGRIPVVILRIGKLAVCAGKMSGVLALMGVVVLVGGCSKGRRGSIAAARPGAASRVSSIACVHLDVQCVKTMAQTDACTKDTADRNASSQVGIRSGGVDNVRIGFLRRTSRLLHWCACSSEIVRTQIHRGEEREVTRRISAARDKYIVYIGGHAWLGGCAWSGLARGVVILSRWLDQNRLSTLKRSVARLCLTQRPTKPHAVWRARISTANRSSLSGPLQTSHRLRRVRLVVEMTLPLPSVSTLTSLS